MKKEPQKRTSGRQKGVVFLILLPILAVIVMITFIFTAAISGQFKRTNSVEGSGTVDENGNLVGQGEGDGCSLSTKLDTNQANVTKVEALTTGYYSPRPGQDHYNKGNYEDEKRMNAPNDPHTASGVNVAKGAVAVDTTMFPFGTVFDIPGYGRGVAVDRGGKVNGVHLDLWMGIGDAGLDAANSWGSKKKIVTVYKWPLSQPGQTMLGSITRECTSVTGTGPLAGGKGCPAIAQNAAALGSRLELGYHRPNKPPLWDYMPGVTPNKTVSADRYWCTDLVTNAYKMSGFGTTPTQSAAVLASWFKNSGKAVYWANGAGTPAPGDFIDFNQDGGSGHHVGVVVSVEGSCFISAEANTQTKYPDKKYCLNGGKYTRRGNLIFGFARLKNCI